MSQENVDVIRRAFDALNDWELASDCYDPEVEYTTQPDAPMRTTYKGLDGLRRSMRSLGEAWENIKTEPQEFIQADDVIVALLRFQLRGHSGVELETDQAWVYWMHEGRIRRMEQYGTKREALQAAGLSE